MRAKYIVGLLLIFGAVILGLYVGVYLMLFKGIVSIIGGIKGGWVASKIAWGVVRVLLAGAAGWLSFAVLFIPGITMLGD